MWGENNLLMAKFLNDNLYSNDGGITMVLKKREKNIWNSKMIKVFPHSLIHVLLFLITIIFTIDFSNLVYIGYLELFSVLLFYGLASDSLSYLLKKRNHKIWSIFVRIIFVTIEIAYILFILLIAFVFYQLG